MIPVAIIGAGPAGLSVGVELRRLAVECAIFEAGPEPLHALRRIDPSLHLVSPSRLSRLPGLDWPQAAPYLTFGTLMDGLDRWRQDLEITCHFPISRVEAVPGGYRLEGPAGPVEARVVVGCTGVLSQPHLPTGIGPTPIPWWHARDVRRAHIEGRRSLLVVGGGVSAGEVLATWLATAGPHDQARISLRSPLHQLPHHILGLDTHYLAWPFEHLPSRLGSHRFGLRHEPLLDPAAQQAIRSGRIQKVSGFKTLEGDTVQLADGSSVQPDAVVFATGYTHSTPLDDLLSFDPDGWPILRRCEARPGLYLVGMRFARSLASPFLRGIGRDARYVARRIGRFLQQNREVAS